LIKVKYKLLMLQLPKALIESLKKIKNFDEAAFIDVHLENSKKVTSIRLNPQKNTLLTAFNISEVFNDKVQKVPWCNSGIYLFERPSFTLDPLLHAGAYYVQEASSMFIEQFFLQHVDLNASLKVLDLCAAPGGKSTLIQSLISAESFLVSNELVKQRVNVLTENITKWGAENIIVTNNEPQHFAALKNYFDVIVVDAPCSGSGLFRKDKNAIAEWSEESVEHCSIRQKNILNSILPCLKKDGVIIYSTCSYSIDENEMIGDWFKENFELQSLPVKLEDDWGIVETLSEKTKNYGYRFYPNKVKGEGFFVTAFKNTSTVEQFEQPHFKNKNEKISIIEIEAVSKYLKNSEAFFYVPQQDEILAIPTFMQNDLYLIQSILYIKKAGIKLGSVIRKELIPHHELALSNIINTEVATVSVSKEMALQYLRKAEIKIETDLKGWVIITYNNFALGWIKILPNRINNYYPKEWRIFNK
jgi:16S rRNA C967 or C1407 C5-methylase (RsmB/RsmF family)/NOL1/NOP2/fmu family ribosome biogenesis protein